MQIEANVDVEIDGQPALLKGQADQLELLLGHEQTLVRLLQGNNQTAGHLANRLADLGLTLTISAESQPIIKAGHGVSSRISAFITGSRHLAPANLSGLFKLLRGYLLS